MHCLRAVSASVALFALLLMPIRLASAPNFDLVGFAAVQGMGHQRTSGGDGGAHVQVSTLTDLVRYLETNVALRVEIMNDIDLSPLRNASQGFPTDYPTGEVFVNSNKTIYSQNGAAIRRGTLRIGKGPNGKHNIIIRNLRFRDLWVLDPTGQYDEYGWDFISIESGSHHIWVDHCEFDQVYDGMVDIKGAADFVTVSWNIFRNQKKCNLVGASDSATADRGHLNVTFHHNWYHQVEERIPRMRFGNAHVFNLYCNNLGGKGIQSTTEAATLVENVYFHHPRSGSNPTIEQNGGGTGIVKVVNSVIVNLPGVNVSFRQHEASNFLFNPPFAAATPPYVYTLDPVNNVPSLVTNYAGVGQIGFELWQMDYFSSQEIANGSVSGRDADADGDGMTNHDEFVAGTHPRNAGSSLRLLSVTPQGPDVIVTWKTAGRRTNVVEASTGSANGFADVSGPIVISTSGDAVTSYVDAGAVTNGPVRLYRIRLKPAL